MTAAPAIKKTDFQKSCKKNVQDPQLVLVERLASPYRQSIASALRLAVRTSPFHGENRGSIPLGRTSDFNGLANPNPKNHRLYGKYTEKCFGEHMLFEPSITGDLTANRRFLLRRLEAIRDYVRPSFKRHKSGIVLLVLDGGRSLCFFDCQVKGTKSLTQTRPPQQLAGSCNSNLNLYKI